MAATPKFRSLGIGVKKYMPNGPLFSHKAWETSFEPINWNLLWRWSFDTGAGRQNEEHESAVVWMQDTEKANQLANYIEIYL